MEPIRGMMIAKMASMNVATAIVLATLLVAHWRGLKSEKSATVPSVCNDEICHSRSDNTI